jgi:hypothetical protein
MFPEGIHFRSGALYLVGGIRAFKHVKDKSPEVWRVRFLRFGYRGR